MLKGDFCYRKRGKWRTIDPQYATHICVGHTVYNKTPIYFPLLESPSPDLRSIFALYSEFCLRSHLHRSGVRRDAESREILHLL
jgi:hypothetical protein